MLLKQVTITSVPAHPLPLQPSALLFSACNPVKQLTFHPQDPLLYQQLSCFTPYKIIHQIVRIQHCMYRGTNVMLDLCTKGPGGPSGQLTLYVPQGQGSLVVSSCFKPQGTSPCKQCMVQEPLWSAHALSPRVLGPLVVSLLYSKGPGILPH